MLKYLFLIVAGVSIVLGCRNFISTTENLLDYYDNSDSVFKRVDQSQIKVLNSAILKSGSTSNPTAFLVLLDNKRVSILDLNIVEQTILIKRTPQMDSTIEQKFGESLESYEYVKNIFWYFLFKYSLCLFLFLFGFLFVLGAYAIKKGPIKEE